MSARRSRREKGKRKGEVPVAEVKLCAAEHNFEAYNPTLIQFGGAEMAKTKQLSVSVDNKPGAVAEIVRTLANAKVNILALLAWAEGPSGTVQVIVEDARRAKKALDDARIAYQEMAVDQVELANKPGTLAKTLDQLAAKGVNLNAIYATATKGGKKAVVVYAVAAEAAKAATA
jgi:hypothetical protein